MPNKNYVKGRRKEYKIVKAFEEKGYNIVQRTAGSHSAVDVIAISRSQQRICLIQSKPESMPEAEKNKIKKENEWLNQLFKVDFFVI